MKKKWLVIGIILLFLGTCIIPATAQDSKIITPSETGLLKRVDDVFKKGDLPKHPILFTIVLLQVLFRQFRGFTLLFLSGELEIYKIPEFKVKHPLLFIRAFWLLAVVEVEFGFWTIVSDSLGWNWPIFEL